MTVAVRLVSTSMRFRNHQVLDRLDAAVEEDVITGLLGSNGAGKTTLLRLVAGHLRPTAGGLEVLGRDPYEDADVLARTCFVGENQRYPDTFRVREVLRAVAVLYPGWDEPLAQRLVRDFGLPTDRLVKKFSRGMTSALGIVVGLSARAPLTLFDEPYLGLDLKAQQLFHDRLLNDHAEHPRTILLSTHHVQESAGLFAGALVLEAGRVVPRAGVEETLR